MQPDTDQLNTLLNHAERLLKRLEILLPPLPPEPDWDNCTAFRWRKRAVAELEAKRYERKIYEDGQA
jgi:predicted AAA+ superfamily ATPase